MSQSNKTLNKWSRQLTQDPSFPASHAMLYGAGMTDADMGLPQAAVCSMGYEINTCNMHLNAFAKEIKTSLEAAGIKSWIFHTIGVSDGISMGTQGMKFSLPSRDIIADSIEDHVYAHYYDCLVCVPGCDKNMPGSIIAMGRLGRPAIMVYGGTIRAGHWQGRRSPSSTQPVRLDRASRRRCTPTPPRGTTCRPAFRTGRTRTAGCWRTSATPQSGPGSIRR